jgi:hypothetical protein
MAKGWEVNPEQIRAHAENVALLRDRFGAVKSASSHISQNDAAYGTLCGWISGILEGRHTRQDELIAYVEENLAVVCQELRRTAEIYENIDNSAAENLRAFLSRLGQ